MDIKKCCCIAIIALILLLSGVAYAQNNWTISGNTVYIDTAKAYISASPHTIQESGYVYFNISSKTYTGTIDTNFGFNTSIIKPKSIEKYSNGTWVSMSDSFDSMQWNFDGFNIWYSDGGIPVTAGQYYNIRVWMDLRYQTGTTGGKYGLAIKPSFQTLDQAKNAGTLYYLDPWFNSSWQNAIFFPPSLPGIYFLNMTNASGANNATNIFLNGHSAKVNVTDVRVTLNNTTANVAYWYDNDTLSTNNNGNMVLIINNSAQGLSTLGIYYNNSGVSHMPVEFNLTKVMPYADGWNGFWNYTYTNGAGANQNWVRQSNGSMMQTNTGLSANKNHYITGVSLLPTYQVSAKIKMPDGFGTSGRVGVKIGQNDVGDDIGAININTAQTTENVIIRDNVVFGTAGNNAQTLSTNVWFMVDGLNSSNNIPFSRIYEVNGKQVNWQGTGAGGTFASVTPQVGLYGGFDAAVEYKYWYAWNGVKTALGQPTSEFTYTSMQVLSYSNNLTNDNSLSLATFVPKIIMFNASLTTNCDNCTWVVNGAKITNFTSLTQTSTNFSFTSPGSFDVNLTAYNNTFGSTAYINWTVVMSILTSSNLDGFVNNTPLGAYVDAVRVDLINTTGTGSNFTTYTHSQPLVNNTDLAPAMGTGQRIEAVLYYANTSSIDVYVFGHTNNTAGDLDIDAFIDGVKVQDDDAHTIAATPGNRSKWYTIPQGSSYLIDFTGTNLHHYEWREYNHVTGYYYFKNIPSGNYNLLFRQVGYDNLTMPINLTSNMRVNATISPTVENDADTMGIATLAFILAILAICLVKKYCKTKF